MAIAFDAVSKPASPGYVIGLSSISWSHTCTGSNGLLVVLVNVDDAGGTQDRNPAVTYNSVSMTRANLGGANDRFVDAGGRKLYYFYLLNPSTGSNTIAVTCDTAPSILVATAASYTGVNQSGQPDAGPATANSSGVSISTNVTTVADNSWFIAGLLDNFGTVSDLTMTSGTKRDTAVDNGLAMGDNPKTPAGVDTISFNATSGYNLSIWGYSFSPDTGGGSPAINYNFFPFF